LLLPRKFLEKSPSATPGKNPSDAHEHNSLKIRITPELATAIRYPINKHSTFLRHKVIHALANATALFTVMVIITLKTIFNEKLGYHFCEVILSYWLLQKVVLYRKYKA